MDNLSNWQALMDASATMVGFLLVVITVILNSRQDGSLSGDDAKIMMFASFAGILAFSIALLITLYISFFIEEGQTKIKELALLYFIFPLLTTLFLLFNMVRIWIKQPDNKQSSDN